MLIIYVHHEFTDYHTGMTDLDLFFCSGKSLLDEALNVTIEVVCFIQIFNCMIKWLLQVR